MNLEIAYCIKMQLRGLGHDTINMAISFQVFANDDSRQFVFELEC